MLCSWGSYSMIYYWSRTDWEKLTFYWGWSNNWEDFWDLMPWWVHGEGGHRSGGGLCQWWCLTSIFWQGEILWGNQVFLVLSHHLQWGVCISELVKKWCFLCTWVSGRSESVEVPCSQWVFCTVLWRVCGMLQYESSCLGRIFVG